MSGEQHTARSETEVGSPTKRERLLDAAAALMARQGYEQTTIRDVGRVSNLSLAGMYYYFKSKDDLLYQIQHSTFARLLDLQETIAGSDATPREKLEQLVQNHLRFFTDQTNEMKVCAFELESLKGEHYRAVERLRTRYFRMLAAVVSDLIPGPLSEASRERRVRHYTLFMFGMINWIYTWFDPERDTPVTELGREMIDLVLPGLTCSASPSKETHDGVLPVETGRGDVVQGHSLREEGHDRPDNDQPPRGVQRLHDGHTS